MPSYRASFSVLASSLAVASWVLMMACAAPASTTGADSSPGSDAAPGGADYVAVHDSGSVSPICPDVNYYLTDQVGANRSVGATNYENGDPCGALLYLRWVRDNDPLYTGGAPDDRTYWRLSDIYEQLAAAAGDHATLRKTYLDSSRTMLVEAQAALGAASLPINRARYLLDDGRFYETYAEDFPDEQDGVYDLYLEAFRVDPEFLTDAYLNRLAQKAMERGQEQSVVVDLLQELIAQADEATYLQQAYESASAPAYSSMTWPERLEELMAEIRGGDRDPEKLRLAIAIAQQEERDDYIDELLPLYADQNPTPELLCALAGRSARSGDIDTAQRQMADGIGMATSNVQKRDCAYRTAAGAQAGGNSGAAYRFAGQALQYDSGHGRSLYLQAAIVAGTVRGGGIQARAAYWCLADMFNRAAATGDPAIAGRARSAAARYNRAAPSQQEYFFNPGWRPGQRVSSSTGYGSCSTTVR